MAEREETYRFEAAPEYFPGLDFCAAMSVAARTRLELNRQYSRQSFQNRSKIRTPDGWQWLSIPLKGGQNGLPVNEIEIDESKNWRRKHLQSLRYNYRATPFFDFIEPEVIELLDASDSSLARVLTLSSSFVYEKLGITHNLDICDGSETPFSDSSTEITIDRLAHPAVEAIRVRLQDFPYRQAFDDFVPGMSALDLIFNYGPEAIGILKERISLD